MIGAQLSKKKRVEWIDLAKGIGILLVIIGHSKIYGGLKIFIFSFHMPLFFVLRMVSYSLSYNCESYITNIRKDSNSLLPQHF